MRSTTLGQRLSVSVSCGILGMLLALPVARSDEDSAKNNSAPWLVSLAAGYQQAQSDQQPIIVRIGGKACQQCLLLEQEIAKPAAQLALKQWTRVYIDVDESPADARLMAVGPIPALRLLTSQGKLVSTHDGKMTDAEFVKWLQKHHAAAAAKLAPELTRTGPPTELDIVRLIQQFKLRDATIREAALRRLAPYPHTAADGVVTALIEGNLSSRLMSLELLQQWQAPVEGLDPWQPDTITDERVDQLSTWIATLTPPEKSEQLETKVAQQISAEDLDAARKTIASMITANASQARAMRERLARFGAALLPEVYASLKTADTDNARRRLTALRYRLVASDKLVLNWPGGLQSLAATDEATRMAAADELSRRATEQDEALLLELFSDPAPLIREISLRTLQKVGGNQTQTALIRLLEDPEPNVRAAVLKQLTEESPRNLVPQIAKYVEGEENADLVVHAVRFLREAGGREAVACLKTLIVDPSWQVRAEAAEAIGDIANNERGVTSSEKAKAYKVLIETLKDEDSFVVSRAVKGLSEAHLSSAVEPMIQVAHAHPDLAQDVITMLARDDANQKIVLPHLRKFFNHEQPKVRVAAIEGLVSLHSKQVGEELGKALKDSDPQVRIAAGQALFQMLDRLRQQEMNQSIYTDIDSGDYVTIESSDEWQESPPSILGQLLGGLFGGGKTSKPKVVDEPADEEPESVDEPAKVVIEKQDGEADAEVGEVTLIEADAGETGTEADPDAQLKEIRTGKHHPDWAFALADPLLPLLKGEIAEERLAGALPLAALGRDKEAISVLRELTAAHPELVAKIAQALPWLLWEDRQELFRELVPAAKDETGLSRIAGIISQTKNDNNAELLWSLINHEAATVDTLTGVSYSIRELHFPDYYYSPTNASALRRKEAIKAVLPRAKAGTRWQRTMAMALLMPIARDDIAELARGIVEDPDTAADFRADAFQILLLTLSKTESRKTAIAALSDENPEVQKRALKLLAYGKGALASLYDDALSLSEGMPFSSISYGRQRGKPILIEAPEALKLEDIKPLLDAKDHELAAGAAYLSVLLGDADAIWRLKKIWREQPAKEAHDLHRLVYRAIAFLDDATQLEILEQIYQNIRAEDENEVSEFYWTMRSMTGAKMLGFRKRIRDEVGMENLR